MRRVVGDSLGLDTGSDGGEVLAGRYRLLSLVGAGGMGTVYKARDLELDEVVAVKVLRSDFLHDEDMVGRFRREVKLARRITHPNVARVFDIGEHAGERFLTAEFVQGRSLEELLAKTPKLPLAQVIELAAGVCAGLMAAHAQGVIHRDLKPDNVLIADDGRVVLTDFGIARALEADPRAAKATGVVGTAAYMAPEQVEGADDLDVRCDIYALGVLLFELLTGQVPWRGGSPLQVAVARLSREPPDPRSVRPDVPTALAELILRCMARRREDRCANVEEVMSELHGLTLPSIPPARGSDSVIRPPEATSASSVSHPTPPSLLAPGVKSVAVLPFRNAGAEGDAHVAEGLTEEIIDTLCMSKGVRVTSLASVMQLEARGRDPREVGRELGVQLVVDGSVRRLDASLRVSCRLISVSDGFQLWARRFEGRAGDLFALSDQAAAAIAEALDVDQQAGPRHQALSTEAIDLYLRARQEYRRYWPEPVTRALELLRRARALAPDEPSILSLIALAQTRMWFHNAGDPTEAIAAAERAVQLAPHAPEPHLALGLARLMSNAPEAAMRELKRALARGPGLAEVHLHIGRVLIEVGPLAEGMRELELARSLDPTLTASLDNLLRAYALSGRWDDVAHLMEVYKVSEVVDAVHLMAARIHFWRGELDQSVEALARVSTPDGALGSLPVSAMKEIGAGIRAGVPLPDLGTLKASEGPGRRRSMMLQVQAEVLAGMQQVPEALDTIEQAVQAGLLDLVWMERCPPLASIRTHPRYAGLVSQVKERADAVVRAYREAEAESD